MAITKARMQVKRGNESDFDPSQMLPGEWAVSLDTKYVRMCFTPGICVRMATYDAFEADMEGIRDILLEAQTIQEAVARIQTEINDTAVVVEDYSILSKSYAVGGTGKRENEDSDNAKYYYEQTKQISQGVNGIVPMGTVAFADLPTANIVNNAMYNVSDAFTSDARFNDGGGIYYGPGNNVIWTAEGKWDVTASSSVTGIKGSAESAYRVGNVNITPSNIGLGNVENKSSATIRGELTKANVTDALGYTPPTPDTVSTLTEQVNALNSTLSTIHSTPNQTLLSGVAEESSNNALTFGQKLVLPKGVYLLYAKLGDVEPKNIKLLRLVDLSHAVSLSSTVYSNTISCVVDITSDTATMAVYAEFTASLTISATIEYNNLSAIRLM